MSLFKSFFMGGYECADHINRSGERVNLLFETLHDKQVSEDYKRLRETGIKTVREGICWSNVEKQARVYDFTEVENRIQAAERNGIQQIWDICHFGYPDDIFPTHPKFTERFAGVCRAFAKFFRERTSAVLFVVPINEISFLSWHSGDVRGTVPFAVNSGFDIKYHLCKAAIAGIKALKEIDPACRILTIEPLIKIHATDESHEPEVAQMNEDQFQAMDILSGRMCPELGGREEYLDIPGFNYYFNNQWEHRQQPWPWPQATDKRERFSSLLKVAAERYNKPILLSETGHFGEHRDLWLVEVVNECIRAMNEGVDLLGICLYPLIERPDWDDLNCYHKSGLWDIDNSRLKQRQMNLPYLKALKWAQEQFKHNVVHQRATIMQAQL